MYPDEPLRTMILVAHDAGVAQILSSWVNHNMGQYDFRFSLQGPAVEIFESKLGKIESRTLEELLNVSGDLIVGTSWQNNSGLRALQEFRSRGMSKRIAILDHWVNYRSRFLLRGNIILPDEIWVLDEYAFLLASSEFQEVPIKRIENYYLNEILLDVLSKKKSAPRGPNAPINLLFLGENLSGNPFNYGNLGYDELVSFDYFLKKIDYFGSKHEIVLTIRPHPTESENKYVDMLNMRVKGCFRYKISHQSLTEDLAESDYVIGISSYALFVSASAGIRTFCAIPSLSTSCPVPHKSIERL